MGFFSNATEGDSYQSQFCNRCVHGRDPENKPCMVWFLHLVSNYDGANDPEHWLHALIPRDKDGQNQECSQYVNADDVISPDEQARLLKRMDEVNGKQQQLNDAIQLNLESTKALVANHKLQQESSIRAQAALNDQVRVLDKLLTEAREEIERLRNPKLI